MSDSDKPSVADQFLAAHNNWKLRTWDPHVRAVVATIKVVPTAIDAQSFFTEPGMWEKFQKGIASSQDMQTKVGHFMQNKIMEERNKLIAGDSDATDEETESWAETADASLDEFDLPALEDMIGRGGIGLLNRTEEIYKNRYTGYLLDGISYVNSEGLNAFKKTQLLEHPNVRKLKRALEKLEEQWKSTPMGMFYDANKKVIVIVGKVLLGLGGIYGIYRWYLSGNNINVPVIGDLSDKLKGVKVSREIGEVQFDGEVTHFNPKDKIAGVAFSLSDDTKPISASWNTSGVLDGSTGTFKTGMSFKRQIAKNWSANYGFAGGISKKDYLWNARGPVDTTLPAVEGVYDLNLSIEYKNDDLKIKLDGSRSQVNNKKKDELSLELGGHGYLGRSPYAISGSFTMDNDNTNESFRLNEAKLIFSASF